MVAMAICLMLVVSLFFWLVMGPLLNATIHRMTQPAAAEHSAPHGGSRGSEVIGPLASSPVTAHLTILAVLLLILVGLVIVTYLVLRRQLSPLRSLSDGVARLRAGELDVALTADTGDEFGRLTRGFNEMASSVKRMVEARDQLLLDVSHELRSPLTRVRVGLELLPVTAARTALATDVAEMERLIAELLEFERLRHPLATPRTHHDLVPLLRDVVQSFAGRAPGIRLLTPTSTLYAPCDEERIRRVLRNLVENAVQYSLPDSRPVEVRATASEGVVEISVVDDGIGISDEDAPRVFEPFFRADRSRSRRTGGVGLGLSLCRRIAETHGGTIILQPRAGRGASFVLTLPIAAPSETA